ncbi:MAG: C4-type zinc ribbon domain-containing protein [Dehalococcoidales bacterium]
MSIARQLYQLQSIELEIESEEQALARSVSQLGESQALVRTRARLSTAEQHLGQLEHEQHDAEWRVEDLEPKLAAARESLYSGRISNPKELSSLQHEVEGLAARRNQLEEKALEIMERVELATAELARAGSELEALENVWRGEQQKLSVEIERLKDTLSELKRRRQLMLAGISAEAVDFYNRLKVQKGWAMARVEQGTCGGCRISLSTAELQRARGDRLVECSSCGRILFLD